MIGLLEQRSAMDRRRLEEGFLLFAAVDVIIKHGLPIERVGYDRNDLAKLVTQYYHDAFVKKWGGKLQYDSTSVFAINMSGMYCSCN